MVEPGTLYVCATPIGNLEDVSLRLLRILKEVDLIAAEDTRQTVKLLNHYEIKTPLISYHEHNKQSRTEELIQKLQNGVTIAQVSDAGTPAISDPGEELLRGAVEAGIPVTTLPGPAAVITALVLSGLSARRFVFEGFLPMDKKKRKQVLIGLQNETRTILLYEAPHRLKKTLSELQTVIPGERSVAICRELTKRHETALRATLDEAIAHFQEHEPKGEFVIVIEGKDPEALLKEEQEQWDELSIPDHMEHYLSKGMDKKEAMKCVAKDRGISKRDVYNELI